MAPHGSRPHKPPGASKADDGKGARSPGMIVGAVAAVVVAIAAYAFLSQAPAGPGVCGDGLCGYAETAGSCPADCAGRCGDGFCSMLETCKSLGASDAVLRSSCQEDCGLCQMPASAAKQCPAEGLPSAVHNASLLWGTYRPHLFLGLRTRAPKPVIAGLMWHDAATVEPLRYEATSGGIARYGWVRHDGESFGHQIIQDEDLSLDVNTTFVKVVTTEVKHVVDPGAAAGGDWAVRVSAGKRKAKRGKRNSPEFVSFILHIAAPSGSVKEPVITEKGVSFEGKGPVTKGFTLSAHSVMPEGGPAAEIHYFGATLQQDALDRADDLVKQIYSYKAQQQAQGGAAHPSGFKVLPDMMQPKTDKKGTTKPCNSMFLQVVVPVGSMIDFVFTSHASHPEAERNGIDLSGPALSKIMIERYRLFDMRFQEIFPLATVPCQPAPGKKAGVEACTGKHYSPEAQEFGKVALSQLLGGMAYLSGTWFKADPPFYNTSTEQSAVVSFSATPCRDGFARGFLWDDGFHLMLLAKWNPAIARDVLLHWFGLMQPDGWIPREQFIGGETRRRIESRWWSQIPTHANPPTLLLALESLIDAGEAPNAFLQCLLPKIQAWLDWFRRSQRGHALHSFKWSGRVRTEGIWHTLSSGLDDYPRANATSIAADRHVDLFCWIASMHRVLAKAKTILGVEATPNDQALASLRAHLDVIHWNNDTKSYADRGLIEKPGGAVQDLFVEHIGYISIFPILLQLASNTEAVEHTIRAMADSHHLLSRAGLRSLSKHAPTGGRDPVYGTQEDYWRGKVWVPMNFLALRALKTGYRDAKGADALYKTLRASLVQNMLSQYTKHGFLFEQYHDASGEGLKHKPFAGWSALVLLAMGERY